MFRVNFRSVWVVLSFCFLYIPIIILMIYSFNNSKFVSVWGGWSLKWYRVVLSDRYFIAAVYKSLQIAIISSFLGTCLGTISGIVLVRFRFFSKNLFVSLIPIPMVMPEMITGMSLLMLFKIFGLVFSLDIYLSSTTIIIAHTTVCMSYVALLVGVKLSELDSSIEEAAIDLGASPITRFIHITLPIIKPTLISSLCLAFAISLDDFIISYFTSGVNDTTIPMLIYSRIKFGVNPEINVFSTIIMLISFAIILFALKIKKIKEKNI